MTHLYVHREDRGRLKLLQAATSALGEAGLRIHDDLANAMQAARQPDAGADLFVLAPRGVAEVVALHAGRDLWFDRTVVILLADTDPRVLPLAHELRPRLVVTRPVGGEELTELLRGLTHEDEN